VAQGLSTIFALAAPVAPVAKPAVTTIRSKAAVQAEEITWADHADDDNYLTAMNSAELQKMREGAPLCRLPLCREL
jgi:hypothetical protein